MIGIDFILSNNNILYTFLRALRKHILMMVGNVQVRAAKLVDDMKNLEYPRLEKLDLPTLLHRGNAVT